VEKRIHDTVALEAEAQDFTKALTAGRAATLVTLSGELGAGKTTFTQGVAKALGVLESVTSPTFVLEKIYELPEGNAFSKLVHIDAYRLEGGDELAALGFSELMYDPGNLVLLEWPERVADALPLADVSVSISVNDDGSRTFSYA
jgi:tRNA threonylcarbamoyladenosine biosynthesis protein TsaE